jgi:hypothetical protein
MFSFEPLQQLYFSAFVLSDAAMLLLYLVVNTYIWPKYAFYFCLFPKIVLAFSMSCLLSNRLRDILINLFLASMCNLSYLLCYEEIMLAVFSKQIDNATNWGSLDIFVAVNLDFIYIYNLLRYNFEDAFCECLLKKEKEKDD